MPGKLATWETTDSKLYRHMECIEFSLRQLVSLRHLIAADIDHWYQEQREAEGSKNPVLSVEDCQFMIEQRMEILRKFDSVA